MELAAIAELDRRFGIPGVARVVAGNGGLPKVVVAAPGTAGEIYLHGAHVTGWQPRGAEEVLFISGESRWEAGRAIRGGVPICFPWFAGNVPKPAAPAHGVVRTKAWRLDSVAQAGDAVTVSLSTESDDESKRWSPADFRLVYRATFASELNLALTVINTGTKPFRFEEALHTYFRVGDIKKTRLLGLNTVEFIDKTDADRQKTQHGPITIVSETDRVYLNTRGAVEIEDSSLGRRIHVAKKNSLATVVWNPWIDKSKAMSDFGDAEWPGMVCIETCNVADFAVELPAGEEHQMQATLRLGDS